MLRNVLDIDLAAHKVSVTSRSGAILLFDFKAAFASLSHDFIWDMLSSIGLSSGYIEALKLLYQNNLHFMRVGNVLVRSVSIQSGVRQGCPLSPLLFAICSHLLLQKLVSIINRHGVVCAFADDTAVVVQDWVSVLPALGLIFAEFTSISGLEQNISKTVFIPLWDCKSFDALRLLIREQVPSWRDTCISFTGKYLAFSIWPKSMSSSWTIPLMKYRDRASLLRFPFGLFWNLQVYHCFVASVLSFVMQLEADPEDLADCFDFVFRKVAPGPYN